LTGSLFNRRSKLKTRNFTKANLLVIFPNSTSLRNRLTKRKNESLSFLENINFKLRSRKTPRPSKPFQIQSKNLTIQVNYLLQAPCQKGNSTSFTRKMTMTIFFLNTKLMMTPITKEKRRKTKVTLNKSHKRLVAL